MNKFLTLLIAFTLSAASFADIGLVNRSTVLKYNGAVDPSSVEKRFINVINQSGGSLAIGSIAILDVANDDGASVTTTTTAGQVPMCVIAVTCASAALCKCQTYGLFEGALFDVTGGNAVAGKPFYISETTAGKIGTIAAPDAGDIPGGVYLDAASSTSAIDVFLKLE